MVDAQVEPTIVPPETKPNPHKPWFILPLILGILVVLLFVISRSPRMEEGSTITLSSNHATPTPFPFQEMTISYLRNRQYNSHLGESEKIADNGSYSSYLTSYTSDGLKINALLTIPTGQQPPGWPDNVKSWPAIVFIHGYIPPIQYVTTEKYVDYVDYLARNGFVVLKIDLRGHGSSEGEPGGGYYGSDYVVDTLNAYNALQKASFVDPNAVGLWGHSMAGNIVLRSMAARPKIPASVIWAGAVYSYTDWQKYRINDSSYSAPQMSSERQRRRQELFEKYGSPSADSSFWQKVAPTNYLNDLKGAIEIHHAEDDDVVNIGYSRDLMALLDKTLVPHKLYTYLTGGHNIEGGSFSLAMERTVEFFKKHLK